MADKVTPLAKAEAAKIAEAIGTEGGGDQVDFLTSEDAAREIVARILDAQDFDAVLSTGSSTKAEDVLDVPFVLRDVRFQASGFEDGPPVYALIEAVDPETGETLTITCGSRNVMAQALRLKQLGALPTPKAVRIFRTDRPTASGFYPMWLGAASDEG